MSWLARLFCRRSGRVPTRQVLVLAFHCAAPVERLVLHVPLAEPPCRLCTREFDAEVERMADVLPGGDMWKQRERTVRYVMTVSIVEMHALRGHLNAIAGIANHPRRVLDFF